jgi:hypothetical protein
VKSARAIELAKTRSTHGSVSTLAWNRKTFAVDFRIVVVNYAAIVFMLGSF